MKKQKLFILLASLMIIYIPLESASKQEIFIAKLNAESQKSALREELAEKQRIEQGKQERELQISVVRQLENTIDTDENNFAGESISVLDYEMIQK